MNLEEIKKNAKSDLFFLSKNILNYTKMVEPFHRELANFAMRDTNRKVILTPRGSFKSSVVTVGYTIWRIINDFNLRVLIASQTQRNARKLVKEIKTHFEANQKLIALFGKFHDQDTMWRDDEFIIKQRRKIKREATVQAGSIEKGVLTGQHYDLCILDDPVDLQNTSTKEQIEKTLSYYRLLLSIMDPVSTLVVIGTRYNIFDIYGTLIEEEQVNPGTYDVFIRKAYNEDGSLLIPEVLTEEFLEAQKRSQGTKVFQNQYLNSPLSDELRHFKEEQIQYYDEKDLPEHLYYFMSVDPAISQSEHSDFSGITVVGVDFDGRWFIREALQLRVTPKELVDKIFELAKKYDPLMSLGLEDFMAEKFLKEALKAEGERRGVSLPVVNLPTNTKLSKETRIRGLQPKFERKEVYFKREHSDLVYQVLYFPQLKHDDILDSLKGHLQITFPCDKKSSLKSVTTISHADKVIWDRANEIIRTKIKRKKWINL